MSDYTEVSNDYIPGYYESGTGDIKTRVTGDLAVSVRAKTGKTGDVFIVEHHWDIGYCATCSEEQIDFMVYVGDERVYRTNFYGSGSDIIGAQILTTIGEFNEWLNEGDN